MTTTITAEHLHTAACLWEAALEALDKGEAEARADPVFHAGRADGGGAFDGVLLMSQQWTKAELEDWCRGWCRTPHTTLKAFIDAGFCSDEAPSREEMRLLRHPDISTVDATKAVMSNETRSVIQGLLKYCDPIGVHGDHFRAKALELLQRPSAPTDGRCVWYRGWECCPDGEGRPGQIAGWHACLGGADADCISVDARTWEGLLDEIDDHDMTEDEA